MSRQKALFQCLQKLIKEDDCTSVDHMLKWEYQKAQLFSMKNDEGNTVIHMACLEGRLKCVVILIKHGACAHVLNSAGWTPLHAAAFGGNIEIVRYLLRECSADPLAVDSTKRVASELTLDKDLLELLKVYSEKSRQRKDNDLLISQKCATLERKRSDNKSTLCRPEKSMSRVRSLIVTQSEAQTIRKRFISTSEPPRPHSKYTSNPYLSGADKEDTCKYIPPVSSTHLECMTEERSPNDKIDIRQKFEELRRKFSNFSTPSPSLSRRKLSSKERGNKETRNRDSGVFEEDVETDIENISSNSKKDSFNSEYYKFV